MIRFAKNPLVFDIPQANSWVGQSADLDMQHVIQFTPRFISHLKPVPKHAEPANHDEPEALPEEASDDGHVQAHFLSGILGRGEAARRSEMQEQDDPESQPEPIVEDTNEDAPKLNLDWAEPELHNENSDDQSKAVSGAPEQNDGYTDPALPAELAEPKSLEPDDTETIELTPTTGEEHLALPTHILAEVPPEPHEEHDRPEFMDCFL